MNKAKLTLRRKNAMLGYTFIMPWLVGFLFLFAAPLFQSVYFSFQRLNIMPGGGYELEFLGLANFKTALLIDANFNRILTDSIVNMAVDVPLILFFSLFMAMLLNQHFKGRAMARAIFFLPVILASGAISQAELSGLIAMTGDQSIAQEMNQVGEQFNQLAIVFALIDAGIPRVFIDYIVGAVGRIYQIVSSSGVQILIFLAALQSIPGTMYEVAKMEGATGYETFWKITFPMVSPLILTNIIYTIIDSFADSPITRTIRATAFQVLDFGLSAAMSWLYTIAVCLILAVVGYAVSKRVFYYN